MNIVWHQYRQTSKKHETELQNRKVIVMSVILHWMRSSSKNMFTSSEVDWGRKDTSEQEIVYCLRLTEQRQYLMSLDFSMQQLNFVRCYWRKRKWNKTQADHHEANLIELQCNFDSDLEEDDLFSTFKYQVLSADSSDLTTVSQKSQNKQSQECSHEILEQKAKITKQWAQKKQNLLHQNLNSDKWWTSQVVISEVQHNELNMNEDSNETMNEDKEAAGQQLGFLSQRALKSLQCFRCV
jgi:hypothetical protein